MKYSKSPSETSTTATPWSKVLFISVIAICVLTSLFNLSKQIILTSSQCATHTSGFVIVAIFKDESMNIAEWISHYRWQGALHFYLIDNGSTDDWKSKLNTTGDATVVTRLEPHQQQQHYDSYLPTLRENRKCDWALVVDLDEYMYAKPPTKSLASFFASVSPSTDQIKIPWKLFGSSGFNLQPESVRCSFTERSKTFNTRFTKAAIRIKEIDAFKVHRHHLKSSLSSKLTSLFFNREVLLDNLEGALQINHYAIQSREYFEKVKLHRGDVYWPDKNNIRTWDYFENYDKAGSGYKDHELCSLLNCCNTTKKK